MWTPASICVQDPKGSQEELGFCKVWVEAETGPSDEWDVTVLFRNALAHAQFHPCSIGDTEGYGVTMGMDAFRLYNVPDSPNTPWHRDFDIEVPFHTFASIIDHWHRILREQGEEFPPMTREFCKAVEGLMKKKDQHIDVFDQGVLVTFAYLAYLSPLERLKQDSSRKGTEEEQCGGMHQDTAEVAEEAEDLVADTKLATRDEGKVESSPEHPCHPSNGTHRHDSSDPQLLQGTLSQTTTVGLGKAKGEEGGSGAVKKVRNRKKTAKAPRHGWEHHGEYIQGFKSKTRQQWQKSGVPDPLQAFGTLCIRTKERRGEIFTQEACTGNNTQEVIHGECTISKPNDLTDDPRPITDLVRHAIAHGQIAREVDLLGKVDRFRLWNCTRNGDCDLDIQIDGKTFQRVLSDRHQRLKRAFQSTGHNNNYTELMQACECECERTVQNLLSEYADVTAALQAEDEAGNTALHYAAHSDRGSAQKVRRLYDAAQRYLGAEEATRWVKTRRLRDQWTALMEAVRKGNTKCVDVLLSSGADVDTGFRATPLMLAVAVYDTSPTTSHELVQKLLVHKADPNARSQGRASFRGGWTALHSAVWVDALRPDAGTTLVRTLVENGARVDQANENALTPLMLAAMCRRPTIVKFLLERGADPKKRDALQWGPLHFLCIPNRVPANHLLDCAKLLVDANCDVHAVNCYGQPAWECAFNMWAGALDSETPISDRTVIEDCYRLLWQTAGGHGPPPPPGSVVRCGVVTCPP